MVPSVETVCVIGAGVSGIASIKACLEEGLNPTCYEIAADIGGLWNREERTRLHQSPKIYPNLVVNVCRINSCFSDFPIPKNWPPYLDGKQMLEYFNMYVDHFGLREHIVFNTEVVRVFKSKSYDDTGSWTVETRNLLTDQVESRDFDAVIVASGKWTEQIRPDIPGLYDQFCGQVTYSGEFSGYENFKDKSVIVIGAGNSGCDIACECSRGAKNVLLSARHGMWLLPRIFHNGFPLDIAIANRFKLTLTDLVPSFVKNYVFTRLCEGYLNHDACGIKGKYAPNDLRSTVSVTDELPLKLYTNKVKSRPGTECFTADRVTFDDGRENYVDAVVIATGYIPRFPFLSKDIFPEELSEAQLYQWIFPFNLKYPSTLTFVGVVPSGGGPVAAQVELQSRFVTRVITGKHTLPTDMEKLWRESRRAELQKASGMFLFKSFIYTYQEGLAKELGLLPSLFRLFFTDPRLFFKFCFGPILPAYYRLIGEHKWNNARKQIFNTSEDVLSGMDLNSSLV